ncbi:GMC family oxidoreductase [Amorphus sp. 3PC139-8]|uniref:GMC family oxidoreductase n=1 Tax=Amorphus sp. 3PC139-8 TaxID=2735676 RepID=UPI00345D69A6
MKSDHEADVIVVGSGSGGAVVAGRLARETDLRVLVIEAGGTDRNPLFHVPMMTGILLRGHYANWFYHTEPEPGLNGRRLFWPRGKVLGGSSSINGMVWTRGLPTDYYGWAQMGLPEWSWDKVLPAYRRIEGHWGGDSDVHGGGGPQPLSTLQDINPLSEAFLEAGQQAGLPLTTDFNGPAPEGVGRYDYTISNGRRVSSARAFLVPEMGRANLTVLTGAQATRVLVDNGRAAGVEIVRDGKREICRARHEVVLSGGTVNTPQLLMLSGIGPADELARHGIDVAADLPGVGKNLQDHLLVRVEYDCTEPVSLHRLMRADKAAFALVQAIATGTGPAARFPLEAGAFLRSGLDPELPDLQAHFLPGRSTATVRLPFSKGSADGGHGFFANIYQMRPESRGEITLASADPLKAPAILGNYLSAPKDIAVLREGVRRLREIFAQPAFDRYRGAERKPGADLVSDDDLDDFIRANADTVFHPVGSCRMGTDTMAVCDGRLRVNGIDGLRIADASAIPTMASCNTHAPTMLIGFKAADFVREDLAAGSSKEAA